VRQLPVCQRGQLAGLVIEHEARERASSESYLSTKEKVVDCEIPRKDNTPIF